MKKKMDSGAVYDTFPSGQTISREAFIKECDDLMDPHSMQQDLTRMTMERNRQRTLAMYAQNEIDKAIKGK